jgi:RHS repeat-associated protein
MQGAGGVGGLLQTTICTGTGGSTQSNNYPLFDGNGNVTDYVSQAGTTVASYKYDAFGNTHTSSGTLVNSFNYRFSTKVRDSETGLYYYGYRYYNTTTGKWINRDPIEETGGVNVYGFVGNDGINILDILGNYPTGQPGQDCDLTIETETEDRNPRQQVTPWVRGFGFKTDFDSNGVPFEPRFWKRIVQDVVDEWEITYAVLTCT